ncbi:MAG: HAD-IIIC family phosphatase [Ktedonobacteraceae bacterium]
MIHEQAQGVLVAEKVKSIKCVVWDLDNTIWNGILLEDTQVTLRPSVVEALETLDSRGILLSIASRNDHETTMRKLEELDLKKYFLYPQINWNTKSSSIQAIAKSLNISMDTFAFIDDQPFEREEVNFAIPEILCIDAARVSEICALPEMMPRFITDDSHQRRQLYLSDIERNTIEKDFVGSNEEFLATLDMTFTIAHAQEEDLRRAEELTVRTHQLNTTGYTYSYEELNAFRHSSAHKLFVSGLEDKYGTYGKIGLTLIECQEDAWIVKLLLMSCRVMSRSVGSVMMNYLMNLAKQANVRLLAEFVPNDRNRMMYVTYKFGGFKEVEKKDNLVVFEADLARIQPFPSYVTLSVEE